MNYVKHYNRLIERAANRVLNGYKECHHVMPKCLGGTNDKSNLVYLTAEEHYVAHKLLCFIYPNNSKLIYAAKQMTLGNSNQKRNNKLYGWLKREASLGLIEYNKNRVVSEETRKKQSLVRLGIKRGPHTQKTKEKMSFASKNKSKSNEHKMALSVARTGIKIGKRSEHTKAKMSLSIREALKNKDYSERKTEEYREKQAIKAKESWAKRKSLTIIN